MESKTLGLDDLGREIVMSAATDEDGTSGQVMHYAVQDGHWVMLSSEPMTDAQLYQANAWRRQYDSIKNIMEISKPVVMGIRGSGKYNALMQAYCAAAHQRRGYQVQIFDNLDFSSLEIKAAGMAGLDSTDNTRIKMGSTRKNRHHKAKPQPNRGPLPRKEWK